MLTLVWPIAGICVEDVSEEGPSGEERSGQGVLGAARRKWTTRTHGSAYVLRHVEDE